MARNSTGKYFQLYDVTRTRVIRQLDSATLNRLAGLGQIGWFPRKGKMYPCVQPLPLQSCTAGPLFSKVPLVQTDAELNVESEMLRSYGYNRFGQVDPDIVGNRVDQSKSKVEIWPAVYDSRSVVICAGQVRGATIVSAEKLSKL
jgi:hypothetical protein